METYIKKYNEWLNYDKLDEDLRKELINAGVLK